MKISRNEKGSLLIMMFGFFLLLLTFEFAIFALADFSIYRANYTKRKNISNSLSDMGAVFSEKLEKRSHDNNPEEIFADIEVNMDTSGSPYFNISEPGLEEDKKVIYLNNSEETDKQLEVIYLNKPAWFGADDTTSEEDKKIIYFDDEKNEAIDLEEVEKALEKLNSEGISDEGNTENFNPEDIIIIIKKDEENPDSLSSYTNVYIYTSPTLINDGFFTLQYYYESNELLEIVSTGYFEGVTSSRKVK